MCTTNVLHYLCFLKKSCTKDDFTKELHKPHAKNFNKFKHLLKGFCIVVGWFHPYYLTERTNIVIILFANESLQYAGVCRQLVWSRPADQTNTNLINWVLRSLALKRMQAFAYDDTSFPNEILLCFWWHIPWKLSDYLIKNL